MVIVYHVSRGWNGAGYTGQGLFIFRKTSLSLRGRGRVGGVFRYDAKLPMGQDFTLTPTLSLRERENEKALIYRDNRFRGWRRETGCCVVCYNCVVPCVMRTIG